jgi:hypothetical protein
MTRPDPRPGAHNHVEGVPEDSLDYVREMGESHSSPADVDKLVEQSRLEQVRRYGHPKYRLPDGVPSKLGRAIAEPLPRKWFEVPVTALIYALDANHARAIALDCTKGLSLGGRAAWYIGEPKESPDA